MDRRRQVERWLSVMRRARVCPKPVRRIELPAGTRRHYADREIPFRETRNELLRAVFRKLDIDSRDSNTRVMAVMTYLSQPQSSIKLHGDSHY